MDCLKCGSDLEFLEGDDRVEWYSESYRCTKCGQLHKRLQVMQTQSSLIASDELYMVNAYGQKVEVSEDDNRRCPYCGDTIDHLYTSKQIILQRAEDGTWAEVAVDQYETNQCPNCYEELQSDDLDTLGVPNEIR